MAKKKKVPKATAKRPATSPYTSLPTTLRFGPDQQSYYVPKALLQSLGELCDDPWDRAASLPDVDAETGHVIVHFLHTGTYQTLLDDGEDVTTSLSASKEFLKAALVCVAARKYKLNDLEELARKEMEQCGKDVRITELVQLISEDIFGALCNDSPWLHDFLTEKVEMATKNEGDVFSRTDFFASIASFSLTRFLAQKLVSIYHKENFALRSKTAASNGHSSTTTASPGANEALEVESSAPTEERIIVDPPSEPVYERTVSDHALHDLEFGATASKKKKKKVRKTLPSEPEEIIESLPGPVLKPALDVVESVIEVKSEPAMFSGPEPVSEAVLVMIPERGPEIEATPVFEPPGEAMIAIPEAVHAEPAFDPFAGLSKSQRKKLEKKLKEEYRLAEEENVRVTKAMEGNAHKFDSPEAPLPSTLPPPEPASKPECIFDYSPPAESTPVVVQDQLSGDWSNPFGSSKMKKKKKQGAVCFDDTLADQEATRGSDLIEEVLPATNTEVPEPRSEVVAVAHSGEECPWRVEHLSESDSWRACAPCVLYVRRIASKLYPAESLDAN